MPSLNAMRQTCTSTIVASIAAMGLASSTALADGPTRFKADIDGFGVARHTIEVTPGTTWAVSIDTDSAAAQMFVSTRARFSPHDAECGAESSCTVEVQGSHALYVFVLAEESTRYDVLATPAQVKASR